jgi:hypothetical protein
MHDTTATASPLSYSKVCDTSRPRIGQRAAIRTDLGGKAFVHFLKPRAMLNSLVRQLSSEGRPADIIDRLRHAGFGKSGSVHVANDNVIVFFNNRARQRVQEVVPAIGDLRVNCLEPFALAGALRCREGRLGVTIQVWRRHFVTFAHCDELLESQIDADAALWRTKWRFGHFEDDIEVPIPTAIAREVGAVGDFPLGQGARIEDAESITCETESIAFPLELAPFQRHPSERLLAPIAQARPMRLGARARVLLAHIVDRSGMQAELLAASGRQLDQVKAGEPRPIKTQRIFLPVVAVVPDEVDSVGLPVKQSSMGFDTISVHELHISLTVTDGVRSIFNNRASTASQSVPYTPRPEGRGFSGQI